LIFINESELICFRVVRADPTNWDLFAMFIGVKEFKLLQCDQDFTLSTIQMTNGKNAQQIRSV
jgi:hypothetical protein